MWLTKTVTARTSIIALRAELGRFDFVKDNIELMLILIVLLSVLPIVVELVRARRSGGAHAS